MKRLLKFSRPYYIYIAISTIASICVAMANVWVIDILKNIIDESINGGSSGIFVKLGEGVLAILLGMAANYLVIYTIGYYGAGVLKDIRSVTIQHVTQLAPDYMEKNNFGDLMARMSSDVEGISGYLSSYFKDCIYVPILVIIFVVYLVYMNPVLAIACLFPLLILVPISIKLMKPIKYSQYEYMHKLGKTNNNIQEVCDGIDIVKSYNLEKTLEKKYYKDLKETLDISVTNDLRQYNVEPISRMISELPVAIALCLGGYLVFQDKISLGVLIAFVSVMKKLIDPLQSAYQLVVRTKMAMVSVERVFYILDEPKEQEDPKQQDISKQQQKEQYGKINLENEDVFTLKNVSFAYDGMVEKKNALEGIDLTIGKGKKIAFVGRSGGGKSTLLKLLYKHYVITEGEMLYHGIPFSELNPNQLRDNIALISQDAFLFPMSIKDNIRIGNPNASIEEIINAAKVANCNEFIEEFPEKYETLVGEKGTLLSGGQKQRISIARAILKNCPVILLDEPTSALDKKSEKLVNEAIDRISKDKTVVVVAHRITTIVNADEIVVIDDGKIVEKGKHDILMKRNGLYSKIYTEYVSGGGYMA